MERKLTIKTFLTGLFIVFVLGLADLSFSKMCSGRFGLFDPCTFLVTGIYFWTLIAVTVGGFFWMIFLYRNLTLLRSIIVVFLAYCSCWLLYMIVFSSEFFINLKIFWYGYFGLICPLILVGYYWLFKKLSTYEK